MKNIYTWDAKPARRNLTVADIKAKKAKEKLTQVTANTADEAHAAGEASIDVIQKMLRQFVKAIVNCF